MKLVAYRVDYPPGTDSIGRDRFFGVDDVQRMNNNIRWFPETNKPKVVPLYSMEDAQHADNSFSSLADSLFRSDSSSPFSNQIA